MSFKIDNRPPTPRSAEIALLQGSNPSGLTTSSLLNFSDSDQDITYNGISTGLTIGSGTLTLGEGHWTLQAYVGISNSDSLANYVEYRWSEGNVGVGSVGASEVAAKCGVDSANYSVTVLQGQTKTLKVAFTTVSGTCTVNSDFSPVVVWKVAL